MSSPRNDTESRILEAARTVFVRKGTRTAKLKEIAEEADVNQALLHYYYRDKKTLADTVFEKVASEFFPQLEAILNADQTVEEKVRTFVPKYIDVIQDNPYLPSYIVGELNHNPTELKNRIRSLDLVPFEQLGPLDRQLKQRAEEGTLRPISAEQFVMNLVSLCVFPFIGRPLLEAAMGMEEDDFGDLLEERKEAVPEFFLSALRP
ncbi:MAG: TetR/AcrR family transcriptional regulator [Salinibacter sp.]|uniref:TetR/AcrR family transcriptional regulator n=1 Tax=Salinibacter sp. TaxID=2065818 RepID=UPI002FC3822B